MCCIDINKVKIGFFCAQGSVSMPSPNFSDIGQIHGARLKRVACQIGHADSAHCDFTGFKVCHPCPAQTELNTCQRAMGVHFFGHQGMGFDVSLVPKRCRGVRRIIRRGVHRAIFSIYDTPATFCFDFAQPGKNTRALRATASTMGHLVKSVFGSNRADFYRLEQDIVTGITHGLTKENFALCSF